MEDLTKDKALLIVAAVGVFCCGYYIGEYGLLPGMEYAPQTYSVGSDDPNAIEADLSASAYQSIENVYFTEDPFVEVEDVSVYDIPAEPQTN